MYEDSVDLAYKFGYEEGRKDAMKWHSIDEKPEKAGQYVVKFKYYQEYELMWYEPKKDNSFYSDDGKCNFCKCEDDKLAGWFEIPDWKAE